MKVGELFWELGLDMGSFDKELDESDRKAQSVSSGVENGFKMAALGIAAAAGVGFHSWHEGYEAIRTQTGATGDELKALEQVYENVAGQVKASLGEIGEATAFAHVKTGLYGDELEALVVRIIKLAEVTGGSATTSVENVVKLFGAWEVQTEDQASALDLLFAAYQKTGVGVEQLTSNSLRARTLLQSLGMDIEDSIALAAKLGTTFPQVFAGLRIALSTLSKDESVKDIPKAFNEIVTSIQEVGSESEANRIAIELFGTRAGPYLASQIREGKLELGDFITELKNSHDSIEQAHDDTLTFVDRVAMLTKHLTAVLGPTLQWGAAVATIAAGTGPLVGGIKSAVAAWTAYSAAQALAATSSEATILQMSRMEVLAGSLATRIGLVTIALQSAGAAAAGYAILEVFERVDEKAKETGTTIDDEVIGALKSNAFVSVALWGKHTAEGFLGIGDAAEEMGDSVDQLSPSLMKTVEAEDKARYASDTLAQAHREAAQAARDQWTAELQLAGGMLGVEGAAIHKQDAMDRLSEVQAKVNRLEANGKTETKRYTEAKKEERVAILSTLQAQQGLEESVKTLVEELRHGGSSRKEAISEIREFGRETGISRKTVDEMIGRVDWLKGRLNQIKSPPPIDIKITNMDRAMAMVDGFIGALNSIPGSVPTGVPTPTPKKHNERWAGGPIDEPVFGVGQRTGETYSFGEKGPEDVIPRGQVRGGDGVYAPIFVNGNIVTEDDFIATVSSGLDSRKRLRGSNR